MRKIKNDFWLKAFLGIEGEEGSEKQRQITFYSLSLRSAEQKIFLLYEETK